MAGKIAALGLSNIDDIPEDCGSCSLWGMKIRENTERLLREWGVCGFLAYEEKFPVGFILFGPAKYFPKSGLYPAGPVSKDAIFIACLFVRPTATGQGLGNRLLVAVETEAVGREFAAVEAIAARDGVNPPAVPIEFYTDHGLYIIKDDRRHPRVRLDIGSLSVRPEKVAAVFERTQTWTSPTNA
jgi:GNAT superfamily N-acetyltransferase